MEPVSTGLVTSIMPHPRLPILTALRDFKADASTWVAMIQQWPSTDLDEGVAWLDVLPLTAPKYEAPSSTSVFRALEEKFGRGIWNHNHQGKPWVHHAMEVWKGLPLTLSYDDVRSQCKRLTVFMQGTDEAWRIQLRTQGAWVPWAAAWLSRTKMEAPREAVIEQVWKEGWVPLDARFHDRPLAIDFRHPAEITGWLAAGGDPTITGWDREHPDLPIWGTWHRNNPQLRDLLLQQVPAADVLKDAIAPQRMQATEKALDDLRRKRGRVRAQQWWDALTADADWMMFRHGDSQTPLWLSTLSHCPPILPLLCRVAQEDPRVKEQLSATSALGLGLWHVLLRTCDSRSLTDPLLKQLEAWAPPTSPHLWVGSPAYSDRARVDIHGSVYWAPWKNHALSRVLTPQILVGNEDQQRQWLAEWNNSRFRPAWAHFKEMGEPRDVLIPELAQAHDLIRMNQHLSAVLGVRPGNEAFVALRSAMEGFKTRMGQPLPLHWEGWFNQWQKRLSAPADVTPDRLHISDRARQAIIEALDLVSVRARQQQGQAQQPSTAQRQRQRHRS